MELVAADDRLTPNHISIYLALFQLWNRNRFPQQLSICRNEVLGISKIGSSKTYYKCLHQLHDFGYIFYRPSYNPLKGSVIEIIDLEKMNGIKKNVVESESKEKEIPAQKNLIDTPATQVVPGKESHGTCGKNDTGVAQVVTPPLINNINLPNGKHGKRGAHADESEKELKKMSDAVEKKKREESDQHLAPDFQAASSLESLKRKNSGRKFLIPSLDQVKAFFTSLDHREISPILQNRKNLEFEAIKFFHHYQANGWLVGGKAPMRNWLSAGLSWLAKAPNFNRISDASMRSNPLHVDKIQQYGKPL